MENLLVSKKVFAYIPMITSRNNPFVKSIAALKDKKGRREARAFIVEGTKSVREAAACGCEILHVVVSERYTGELFLPEKAETVSAGVFEKLTDESSPQGILAVVRMPEEEPAPPRGNSLLLDGIADPGNLGTILRTANAAGYEDIYLRGCADPYSPKCVRATMGGIFHVRLYGGDDALQGALCGVPLICADMEGEDIFSFAPPRRFCLVIGNEANGVSEEVRRRCVYTVAVPMRGTCESLNAAVSAGVLMYELGARAGALPGMAEPAGA